MKFSKSCLALLLLSFFYIYPINSAEDLAIRNLVSRDFFYATDAGNDPRMMWLWDNRKYDPEKNFSVENGILTVNAPDKNIQALIMFRAPYEVADKVKVLCRYRLSGKAAIAIMPYPGTKYISLPDTGGEWKSIEKTVDAFSRSMRVGYSLNRGGKLETEILQIIPVAPKESLLTGRKKIIINEIECSEIQIEKTDSAQFVYDLRSALILRKYFYDAGGMLLPITEYNKDYKSGVILVGQAAAKNGLIPNRAIKSLKPGGYAFKVEEKKIALVGAEPGGVISGAFALLRAFGYDFLTESTTVFPQGENLSIKSCSALQNPFFETRINDYLNCAALGYTDPIYNSDARYIGAWTHFSHLLGWLVPQEKYYKDHPEYYALQKDGKRLFSENVHGIHICYSNREVQKLVTKELITWMKANKTSKYFPLIQGDFLDRFCQCKKCRSMPKTDLLIGWVNDVAREVEKECPDKVIITIAYVDTVTPPKKTRPRKNVMVHFCNFHGAWYNHLQTYVDANKNGLNNLRSWCKRFRNNMGVTMYLTGYHKRLDVFPSFYTGAEKIDIYAALKIPNLKFHGTFNGTNSFNPLKRYVYGQMGWNPKLNVEKTIDHFFTAYYGPAAPYMHNFFDLVHEENKRRNLSQYTGDRKPLGLMTRKVANESCRFFDEAEKTLAGEQPYLNRLEKQKMMMLFSVLYDRNPGLANMDDDEIPTFALRMGEFARLGKQFKRTSIIDGQKPEVWFSQTALIKGVNKTPWFDDPQIEKLIVSPLSAISGQTGNALVKSDNGWTIDNEKCAGGDFIKKSTWRDVRHNIRSVRRASSGRGLVKCLLEFDTAPEGKMLLKLEGLDNEKAINAQMEIKVNGKTIYTGGAPFGKDKWTEHTFKIPSGTLKQGQNTLVFLNNTPDEVDDNDAVRLTSKQDYNWGWYSIGNMQLLPAGK